MLNFCPHCGKSWSQTKFCAHCGENLSCLLTDDEESLLDFGALTQMAKENFKEQQLHGFHYRELSGGESYVITGLQCSDEPVITVPIGVSAIADYAFSRCKAHTVYLPEGLKRIGVRAFANAKYLETINLPSTLLDIEDEAFINCERLDIIIPQNVRQGKDVLAQTLSERKLDEQRKAEEEKKAKALFESEWDIQNQVLVKYKGNKREVVIPEGIVKIEKQAFLQNQYICEVKIPESVRDIGESAFGGCTNLRKIHLPDSINSVGYYAFRGCSTLSEVKLSDRLTWIGKGTFSGCYSLKSIDIPDGVVNILEYAFSECSALNSVNLPHRLKTIGDYTFSGCCSLGCIDLPSNLEKIGDRAFKECSSLISIHIPKRTFIGDYAFYHCDSLSSISISANYKPFLLFDPLERIGLSTKKLSVTYI